MQTDLSRYDNSAFSTGAGVLKRFAWYFVNALFLRSALNPSSVLKCWLLRCFGAQIGRNVRIKPSINIKYPWRLIVGDNCWIGEDVWIDNLVLITIENDVCISQGAMLLTGNHNYKSPFFDLIVKEIHVGRGAWLGAKSIVCPGVTIGEHAVLTVASVAQCNLEPFCIYRGNPAIFLRKREMTLMTSSRE